MGKTGPAPTPTAILKLNGSWRAKRNKNEPTPELGEPDKPEWLDEYAAQAWDQIVPKLDAMGVLATIDEQHLTVLVQTWARWRKAEEFIKEHGETFSLRDANGRALTVQRFPQAKLADELARTLNRLFNEFGMSPSARTRIEAKNNEQQKGTDDGFGGQYFPAG